MHACTLCVKNALTLASCSFAKHGLILIIFDKQHQYTFRNDTHIQLSKMFRHFYLLYLLLNSCDRNDTFWHHSIFTGNTGFYLCRSVPAKQSGWPRNPVDYRIWRLMQECVYIVQDTCPRHQRLDAVYQWHKTSKLLINGESCCVHAWRQKNITWTSAKLKPTLFKSQYTTQLALFRATNSLPRKTCCFAY